MNGPQQQLFQQDTLQRPTSIPQASPQTTVLGKRDRTSSISEAAAAKSVDGDTPNKLFRCGDCDKSYSRVDHLARHVRIHTQERPYVCETCGKGFARADLLKRHAAGHNAQPDPKTGKAGNANGSRQSRVNQACEACAELHLKCDNTKPCNRCSAKNIQCKYQTSNSETEAVAQNLLRLSQTPVMANMTMPSVVPAQAQQHQSQSAMNMDLPQTPGPMLYQAQGDTPGRTPMLGTYETPLSTAMFPPEPPPMMQQPPLNFNGTGQMGISEPNFPGPMQNGQHEMDRNELHDFLRGVMGISANDPMATGTGEMRSGIWTPRNMYDFGMDTNLELNDMDLSFLDTYNQHNPFGTTPDATTSALGSTVSESPSEPPLGVESLQKASTWRFRPLAKESSASALQLPMADPNKRFHVDRRITPDALPYTIRDQILAMVFNECTDTRSVLSFPSVELLDSLLQYYLSTAVDTIQLLHTPTLRLSRKRPELCATLIAAGAASAPDAALRKFGFVIQEAARLAIPKALERDNSLIRDLQMIQASFISLRMGFWSGNSRKMEIAESFLQPWTTMIRRGGWFGHHYDHIMPTAEDSGEDLEEKWRRWADEESRKRLSFSFFSHDTRASISLFINPIISYAEFTVPLPQVPALWNAKTATAWKSAYLSSPNNASTPPSTLDLLNNIDIYCAPNSNFDRNIATRALLSATWRMVWEYRQQASITRSVPNQWNNGTLILSSRLEELKRLLECLRIGCLSSRSSTLSNINGSNMGMPAPLPSELGSSPTIAETESLLYLEVLALHLHTPMQDAHIFAGVEGPDEARRVYTGLREWAATPAARQAVWHAAQLLRHARALVATGIADFNAVIVYQSALALWCWGVISNAIGTPAVNAATPSVTGMPMSNGGVDGSSFPWQRELIVLLDDVAPESAKRFVAMNRGRPAIRTFRSAAAAESPGAARKGTDHHSPGHDRSGRSGQWAASSSSTTNKEGADQGYALLSDPAAVMGVAMDLVAGSHRSKAARPPLVENLLELMNGLREAVLVSG